MQDESSSQKDSYSFKIVDNDESVPPSSSREIQNPLSYQHKHLNEYMTKNSISISDSGSDDEILIREPSANPQRFNTKFQKQIRKTSQEDENKIFEDKTLASLSISDHQQQPTEEKEIFQNSDSETDSENLAKLDEKPIFGQYDPKIYENLDVSAEIKEMFQYITKYSPQQLNLDYKLKPFIPDFIPAVGDIDAFLKVIPPKILVDGEPFDANELKLGLTVLDEPSIHQSDKALLHLQLRANSFNIGQADESVVVKKIDRVDKNFKTIDKWIKDVTDLHKSKSTPTVRYSKPMPDLDDLMQEWPEEIETLLKIHGFPSWKLECSLGTYVDIVCSILDIPIAKNKIESLHVLFCLFAAIKSSQLYKSSINNEETKPNIENTPDQLVLN